MTDAIHSKARAHAAEGEVSTPDRVPKMEFEPRSTSSSAASSAGLRLVPAEHVVTAVHGTRTVLLDPRRGRYYGLDEVGGRVWTLATDRLAVSEIVERLAEEYDVDQKRLEADVLSLLDDLQSKRLLESI